MRNPPLTPELRAAVLRAIRRGAPAEVAMAVAGVGKSAWYSWRKRGRDGEEPFATFEAEIEQAEAEQELCYVSRIRKAGRKFWKADAWLLERSKPERWAAKREENAGDEYTVEIDDED